jgi:hypothetical protein
MQHCEQRIGEATFRTPRTTITAFIGLLAVLEQNPTADWRDLLTQTRLERVTLALDDGANVGDELTNLTL